MEFFRGDKVVGEDPTLDHRRDPGAQLTLPDTTYRNVEDPLIDISEEIRQKLDLPADDVSKIVGEIAKEIMYQDDVYNQIKNETEKEIKSGRRVK